jgi:hypothetical protein
VKIGPFELRRCHPCSVAAARGNAVKRHSPAEKKVGAELERFRSPATKPAIIHSGRYGKDPQRELERTERLGLTNVESSWSDTMDQRALIETAPGVGFEVKARAGPSPAKQPATVAATAEGPRTGCKTPVKKPNLNSAVTPP